MLKKNLGRVVTVATAIGFIASAALADEIVHFTNGAEMPVKSHSIDTVQNMVKLDLGGNSYISFPMSMVDKIAAAGQDVFLNPGFHPSNQAIAGIPGTVADSGVHGTAGPVGYKPQPDGKGHAGVMLGEAADAIPAENPGGPDLDNTVVNSRRVFNPAYPPKPGAGGPPQVIMPPGVQVKPPVAFKSRTVGPPAPPAPEPPQDASGDQPGEDPPDTP